MNYHGQSHTISLDYFPQTEMEAEILTQPLERRDTSNIYAFFYWARCPNQNNRTQRLIDFSPNGFLGILHTQVSPTTWTYLPLGTDVIYHYLPRDKFCTLHSIYDSQFSGYLLRVQYMATVIFWGF